MHVATLSMNRLVLLAVLALVPWQGGSALAQRSLAKSLSIKDLGLGMPKKPETPFEAEWTIEAGAVLLHRSRSSSVVLANTDVPADGDVFNASDLKFGAEWGPYVSLSKRVFGAVRGEILYFGVYDWDAASSVENGGGITTGVFDAGPVVFDRMDVHYSSGLDNLEINTCYPFLGRLEWILGFRWTGIDEHSTTLWDGRTGGADFASAAAWAKNDLYGMQLGVDGPLWQPSARFHLDGTVKACVATNRVSTGRDVTGTIETFLSDRRSVTRTSMLLEVGLMGRFDLTQHFILGAGYHLLWVDGIASGFSSLGGQGANSVLFHGLRATIEARW